LDPHKTDILRLLHQHPYSARQILHQLRERGYEGGYSILTDFIRQVRPRRPSAYLTLHFEPGECAQYVKKNFLNGLDLSGSLAGINAAAQRWLDEVANVRIHGETRQKPMDLFAQEKPALRPLPAALYDVGRTQAAHATHRFRIHFDGNRYSVPSEYVGTQLSIRAYPDRLLVYHQHKLIAEHVRHYPVKFIRS